MTTTGLSCTRKLRTSCFQLRVFRNFFFSTAPLFHRTLLSPCSPSNNITFTYTNISSYTYQGKNIINTNVCDLFYFKTCFLSLVFLRCSFACSVRIFIIVFILFQSLFSCSMSFKIDCFVGVLQRQFTFFYCVCF